MVGKLWKDGILPYVEVFDHKGPFLYFVYLVGLTINVKYGIWILQIIMLWITLCAAYKIVNPNLKKGTYGFLTVILILIFLLQTEVGCVLTEEVNLPFLMLATYEVSKYCDNYEKNKEHSIYSAVIYGVAFGIAFCTRATNAVMVAYWVAVIAIVLVIHHKFSNLIKNAVGFLVGFSLIVVPFVIYFYQHHALYDMFYGTIIYNALYATGSSWELNINNILLCISRTWPAWGMVVVSIIYKRRDRFRTILFAGSAILTIYVVSSGNLFAHYNIILAVFIPLIMTTVKRYRSKVHINTVLLNCMIIVMILTTCTTNLINKVDAYTHHETSELESVSLDILSAIPETDRNSVIGYNAPSLFYLYTDIVPCYKYYTMQDWQSSKSEAMTFENVKFYESGIAKWIIVYDEVENLEIKNAIDEKYHIEQTFSFQSEENNTIFKLYALNN